MTRQEYRSRRARGLTLCRALRTLAAASSNPDATRYAHPAIKAYQRDMAAARSAFQFERITRLAHVQAVERALKE